MLSAARDAPAERERVLTELARRADPWGVAEVSLGILAAMLEFGYEVIRVRLQELAARELIAIERRAGNENRYRLLPAAGFVRARPAPPARPRRTRGAA